MKREVWEELIDRVVDNECTDEERRALYEAAERNPEIRKALEETRRIRKAFEEFERPTVPPEFSERLRLAIERSDFWVDREVERPAIRPESTTAARRFGGRRFHWAATGTAVSFAAVALLAFNFGEQGGVSIPGPNNAPNIATSTPGIPVFAEPTESTTARPTILRRPGNKGEAPKEPVVATPSGFYTRRTVDSENAKRLLTEFLRFCNKNNIVFAKIDGDFELTLRKTTPENRSAILEWLDANAQKSEERGETNFAERWDADDKSVADVRVSFFVAKTK